MEEKKRRKEKKKEKKETGIKYKVAVITYSKYFCYRATVQWGLGFGVWGLGFGVGA